MPPCKTPQPDPDRSGLATVREARSYLRVSNSSLYRLMRAGVVPSRKLGKSRRIPWSVLEALATALPVK